jgi:hypothetical protein
MSAKNTFARYHHYYHRYLVMGRLLAAVDNNSGAVFAFSPKQRQEESSPDGSIDASI